MMVNMNGLSNQTWQNFVKALEEFDQPVKSAGDYILKLQEVFTPGHTRQIHVLPMLGQGSLGEKSEYERVSERYCWEIIVSDDSRYGRHVAVCSYFTEPAFEVFSRTLGWSEEHKEQYRRSTDFEKEKKLQEQFAYVVLETIWGVKGQKDSKIMIGQEVFICSNNFTKNYKTMWQENDTCIAVLEERLERFLKSQGISFDGNFRWIPKTFNEKLPKKHKKKPIVEF